MLNKCLFYWLITNLFISNLYAFDLSNYIDNKHEQNTFLAKIASSGVATISLGPVWESGGNTQTFYLAPGIEKTYAANNSNHSLAEVEIFLGIQKLLPKNLVGQLGLLIATTGNAVLSGDIWDDADSTFNNYSYSYNVRNSRVSIKGKLLADRDYFIIPWISGSVGVGFNQAHNFINAPTLPEAAPISNFTQNTVTAFTYTLGAGIQKYIDNHWQAGIGYEFADWGKSELGREPNQTLNTGPRLHHLYTNGFLVNITYVT
jgi:opacity protein-like surface antigen